MSTTLYVLRLTPFNTFFFGGEKTFGMGGNENYLIRSERFPQQTTLLGMLRQMLLEQCGLLGPATNWQISDRNKAAQIIGEKSFHINGSFSEIDFKVIKRISPVFLMKKNERYFPCPIDAGFTLGAEEGTAMLVNAGGRKAPVPVLRDYNPKTGIVRKWISESGVTVSEDEIFIPCEQPGVWKGSKGEEDEEGYYKQYFMRFNGPWSFAFYAELDESIIRNECKNSYGDSLRTAHINMGKERTSFKMEVKSEAGELDNLFFPQDLKLVSTAGTWLKIILLSDAFTENSIYDHCFFGITETGDFRFLQTNVTKTTRYANLSRHASSHDAPSKSGKYNLLKRGSVLYAASDKIAEVKERLENKRFCQIGYNWYGVMNAGFQPLASASRKKLSCEKHNHNCPIVRLIRLLKYIKTVFFE